MLWDMNMNIDTNKYSSLKLFKLLSDQNELVTILS